MTGIYVDHEPCTQPLPWCYVMKEAPCRDNIVNNKFGNTFYKDEDDSQRNPFNIGIIGWSVEACRYGKRIL